jgi:hypothetical protein
MFRIAPRLIVMSVLAMVLFARNGQDRRIRTAEPTVVTVEGARDKGEPLPTGQHASHGKLKSIRKRAAVTARGLLTAAGWLLNADEDVRARRDRIRSHADRQTDVR